MKSKSNLAQGCTTPEPLADRPPLDLSAAKCNVNLLSNEKGSDRVDQSLGLC